MTAQAMQTDVLERLKRLESTTEVLVERVTRLEAERPHLATKADINALETRMVKWVIATSIATITAILVPIIAILVHILSRLS